MTDLMFSTGYSDCLSCGGSGVAFIDDMCVSCPECDKRDYEFQEVMGLDDYSAFGSPL